MWITGSNDTCSVKLSQVMEHTLLCKVGCISEHCELVRVAHGTANRSHHREYLNELPFQCFENCLRAYLVDGRWHPNSDVPDPASELRFPLVYLLCAFGKPFVLKYVLDLGFCPSIQANSTGETGLHSALRYLCILARIKKWFNLCIVVKHFEKLLDILCHYEPRIMFYKDSQGNTPFHVAVKRLRSPQDALDEKVKLPHMSRRPFLKFSVRLYCECLSTMLRKITELQGENRLAREDVKKGLAIQDAQSKTFLRLLSDCDEVVPAAVSGSICALILQHHLIVEEYSENNNISTDGGLQGSVESTVQGREAEVSTPAMAVKPEPLQTGLLPPGDNKLLEEKLKASKWAPLSPCLQVLHVSEFMKSSLKECNLEPTNKQRQTDSNDKSDITSNASSLSDFPSISNVCSLAGKFCTVKKRATDCMNNQVSVRSQFLLVEYVDLTDDDRSS